MTMHLATPTDTMSHIVLTRFNVRLAIYGHNASDDWLRGRLDLFETYCLPSFASQTERAFRWLVFFDSESPQWFRDRIEFLAGSLFEPVYVEGLFDTEYAARAVAERVGTSHVITTRVDNDDAVANDFIATIQSQFEGQDLEFVNLVNGSQLAGARLYLRPYTQNPFVSLVERVSRERLPRTVFVERHYQVEKVAAVRNVRSSHPMWLQVVHGENVLNEIVGLRTRSSRVSPHFACRIEATDRPLQFAAERMTGTARICWRLLRKPSRVIDLARTVLARPARLGAGE